MKAKLLIASLLSAMALPAMATITLNTQFGNAFSSDSTGNVAVANGTLWILVVDSNESSSFAGGLTLNTTLTQGGANGAAGFTIGQQLTLGGLLGGDTIFAMGGFNGDLGTGTTSNALSALTLGTNGLATGRNFAFYWFPGVTYGGGSTGTVGTQAGGIHALADEGAGLLGMVIPGDTASINVGAATTNPDLGGSLSNERFQAVDLIPEPSAALLGLLGAVGLIRRRR